MRGGPSPPPASTAGHPWWPPWHPPAELQPHSVSRGGGGRRMGREREREGRRGEKEDGE